MHFYLHVLRQWCHSDDYDCLITKYVIMKMSLSQERISAALDCRIIVTDDKFKSILRFQILYSFLLCSD